MSFLNDFKQLGALAIDEPTIPAILLSETDVIVVGIDLKRGANQQIVSLNMTEYTRRIIDEITAGVAVWGSVSGDISNQTDLVAELDLKVGEAPSDGKTYVRKDEAWQEVDIPPGWAPTAEPIPPADLSALPDVAEVQAILDYAKTIAADLKAVGIYI